MKQILTLISALMVSISVLAAGPSLDLKPAENNLRDQDSLQRGAELFASQCLACHSIKYMRYNRIAQDIGWSDAEVVAKMSYGLDSVTDTVLTRMQESVGEDVLGVTPPDLSLMARLKGTDYIYTFLTEYYQDEEGNWNNHVLEGTSMPNVLEGIQRHATPEEYHQAASDIANFLEYVGEPAKLKRLDMGWKVIAFLLVLLLFAYLLKKEYWRDVK